MDNIFSIAPAEIIEIIISSGEDGRSIYTGMLHAFGKEKGLEIYHYYKKNWVGQLDEAAFL